MPRKSAKASPEFARHIRGAAAIDIGSRMHMAAVSPETAKNPIRSFGTFTSDLHTLTEWFRACNVTSVAMESTGVYWIPVYEILEQHGFEVILVNARYAKNVPGRKTDVSDAAWLQQLHSYGLLRGSFRAQADIAALRAYLRQRERLVEYAAAHIQHMQKALMEMNLQLHHVVSDITGVTGMQIIRAIVGGERDPDTLAANRDIRCRSSAEVISAALMGNYRDEHVFALTQALELYDIYRERIVACDRRIKGLLLRLSHKSAKPAADLPKPRITGQSRLAPHPSTCAASCIDCWEWISRRSMASVFRWPSNSWPNVAQTFVPGRVQNISRPGFVWPLGTGFLAADFFHRIPVAPQAEPQPFCVWLRRRSGEAIRRWGPFTDAYLPGSGKQRP